MEIVSLYNKIRAVGPAELPGYYKSPVFWMVRLMITVIAGMLAIAEKAGNPLLAINIGAAAPAILQALETPPRSSVGGGNA